MRKTRKGGFFDKGNPWALDEQGCKMYTGFLKGVTRKIYNTINPQAVDPNGFEVEVDINNPYKLKGTDKYKINLRNYSQYDTNLLASTRHNIGMINIPKNDKTVRVLSYNFKSTIPNVDWLNGYQADVICLQNIVPKPTDSHLGNFINLKHQLGYGMITDSTYERNPDINNGERYKLVCNGIFSKKPILNRDAIPLKYNKVLQRISIDCVEYILHVVNVELVPYFLYEELMKVKQEIDDSLKKLETKQINFDDIKPLISNISSSKFDPAVINEHIDTIDAIKQRLDNGDDIDDKQQSMIDLYKYYKLRSRISLPIDQLSTHINDAYGKQQESINRFTNFMRRQTINTEILNALHEFLEFLVTFLKTPESKSEKIITHIPENVHRVFKEYSDDHRHDDADEPFQMMDDILLANKKYIETKKDFEKSKKSLEKRDEQLNIINDYLHKLRNEPQTKASYIVLTGNFNNPYDGAIGSKFGMKYVITTHQSDDPGIFPTYFLTSGTHEFYLKQTSHKNGPVYYLDLERKQGKASLATKIVSRTSNALIDAKTAIVKASKGAASASANALLDAGKLSQRVLQRGTTAMLTRLIGLASNAVQSANRKVHTFLDSLTQVDWSQKKREALDALNRAKEAIKSALTAAKDALGSAVGKIGESLQRALEYIRGLIRTTNTVVPDNETELVPRGFSGSSSDSNSRSGSFDSVGGRKSRRI